ncbi:hypothetical protein [Erwinia phage FBB1]|nr:hypothetical protein [Erwinia phage FBB1]
MIESSKHIPMRLYVVTYMKDGKGPREYNIPANSPMNAVARLGQIYGDKDTRPDVGLDILDVRRASQMR